ncbi:MAG: sugar ABC transporter ATP-binding protein [Lachnospiraceae bacterium]|nr:sugar ABC transporter ATP-binding protein [Lachnospiraceae bacterium]
MKPSLIVKDLDKAFVGVHAVDHLSFQCQPGTVHVLQGENGAGKSTVLKMLSGMYQPDSGEIILNGTPVKFRHPSEARRKGIAMVYQEMSVLPELTVAQNIWLHEEHRVGKGWLLKEARMLEATQQLAQTYGIEVDPYMRTGDLAIAQQQMVEILKALAVDPEILILDEPTSALTVKEVEKLHNIVKTITAAGKTVLFISHRMEEVFEFGDYATILKDGKLVDTVDLKAVTEADIIRMMVGRELQDIFPAKLDKESDEALFRVEDLGDGKHFHNISFELRKGEILGIGALDGQGQTQMMRAIAGIQRHTTGRIQLNGEELHYQNCRKALKQGIGYVPEDRKIQGLCLGMSVRENLSMTSMFRDSRLGFIDRKKETKQANASVEQMNIRTPSLLQKVGNLSGGNQQKVAIGKVLNDLPKVILLNEPTRGIDVEAKQEIYRLIRRLASEGIAVLLYTSDMMETIGLSDRVITMYEGHITGELSSSELTEERIMFGAMGLGEQAGEGA